MRFFAIVSVVAYHITWVFVGEQGIHLDEGFFAQSLTLFFGMDLFFVLSGFLIGSILLRSLATSGTTDLRRFYVRRIFRTFPSYYIVLTFLALAFPLTADQHRHLVWEYLYGTNFLPLRRDQVIMVWGWSLGLEEQFYLTVPFLFLALQQLRHPRARIALLLVLWASALFVRFAIFYRHHGKWSEGDLYSTLYFRTHTRFDALVAGIVLAVVHQAYGRRIAAWLQAPFHRAVVALASLFFFWLLVRPLLFGLERQHIFRILAWGTLTSLMYFGVVPLALYGEGWICRLFGAPVFRRLATLGYGVYLVHIPVIDHVTVHLARAAQNRHFSMLWVWPLCLVLTMLLSLGTGYVLHVLVEKPSLRLRERLSA
jgi:peptidoglycan/LPS O-acetylase OafA/YrhL